MSGQKTLLVIAGPTAVGKTSLAIDIASHLDTEILSADSRQCYREMNIGVARPSDRELSAVKHHFMASHSINSPMDASAFEAYALQVLDEIFVEKDIALMVGGTGLYMKALCDGLDEIPPVSDGLRQDLRQWYTQYGITWLQDQLRLADPEYFAVGEIQNPHRMLRALEVVKATGKPIRYFHQADPVPRPFDIVKIGLELPRPVLYERINQRVDDMMHMGLLEEVKSLWLWKHLQPLQTVGYQELFDFLDKKCTLAEAVEDIKTNTRRYAKRQMTWFRKDPAFKWFSPLETASILAYAESKMPRV